MRHNLRWHNALHTMPTQMPHSQQQVASKARPNRRPAGSRGHAPHGVICGHSGRSSSVMGQRTGAALSISTCALWHAARAAVGQQPRGLRGKHVAAESGSCYHGAQTLQPVLRPPRSGQQNCIASGIGQQEGITSHTADPHHTRPAPHPGRFLTCTTSSLHNTFLAPHRHTHTQLTCTTSSLHHTFLAPHHHTHS